MTIRATARLSLATLWFSGLLALPAALAQSTDKTDTGGGMGGTGNRPEKGLMAEIGNEVLPGCADGQIIGKIVRNRGSTSLIQPAEPLCIDREVQTSTTETALVVVLGYGEVALDPNTAVAIRNAADGVLELYVKRGTVRGDHPDTRLTYSVDTGNQKQKIYVSGKRFVLEVASMGANVDSLRTDVNISALGDTPVIIRHRDELLAVKPPLKASVRIRGESVLLKSASPPYK